ncbi:hypothetical protein [Curtobacterium sp. 260]|uniref:hypothetical protein n=1 Tax=Curtobacterium sp. 260 TaxID=2817748 RepID=UPI002783210F|nr:hypothetical protein [Curtobacterium sp. 260]MDP9735346.1 hypothetical protein [Curtobacterium sp. 260]
MNHSRRARLTLPLLPAAAIAPLLLGPATLADTLHSPQPEPRTAPAAALEGTFHVVGTIGFVAVADHDGRPVLDTRPVAADTAQHPAPGTTGPLVVGSMCLSALNGPGLPFAALVDAVAPSGCLQVRTTSPTPHVVRFTADDPSSPANGLELGLQANGALLALGTAGSDIELVTEGPVVAPTLDHTDLAPGSALSGTATHGAHVVVVRDGTVVCEADAAGRGADDSGHWSCSPIDALTEGTYTLELFASTPAGQLAPPVPVEVVVSAEPGAGDGPDPGPGDGEGTDPGDAPSPGDGAGGTGGTGTPGGADQTGEPSADGPSPGPATTAPTADAAPQGRLAWTGTEVTGPLAVALALLTAGTGVLLHRRRRARSRS